MKTPRERFREAKGIDKLTGVELLMADNVSDYVHWLECEIENNANKQLLKHCYEYVLKQEETEEAIFLRSELVDRL